MNVARKRQGVMFRRTPELVKTGKDGAPKSWPSARSVHTVTLGCTLAEILTVR